LAGPTVTLYALVWTIPQAGLLTASALAALASWQMHALMHFL
jgi:hypothetical protein